MFHRFAAPALLACALAIPLSGAQARTDAMVEYTCPIDGQKFQSMTPMSGTSFGARLDGRRIGPIAVPYPYPVCPGNGFVLYRAADKIDADYTAKAKALVATDEYRRIRDSESKYALAAWIAERLGEEPAVIIGLLREAAWDAEGTDRHARYLRATAAKLRTWQASPGEHNDPWLYRLVLLAELLRQAGDYNDARGVLNDTPREPLGTYVEKYPVLKGMVAELRRRIDAGEKEPISPPRS
jgi:hypothetical protein